MNKIVKASFLLTVFVALTLLPYAVCWEVGPGWTFANTQTTPTPTPTATAAPSPTSTPITTAPPSPTTEPTDQPNPTATPAPTNQPTTAPTNQPTQQPNTTTTKTPESTTEPETQADYTPYIILGGVVSAIFVGAGFVILKRGDGGM